jgi:pimeloyl-ACP methyl ester carboxylesterase
MSDHATETAPVTSSAAQIPDDFDENTIEADGFNIRYLTRGAGETVVYVHGAGGPDLGLAHELLAEHYRVVLLEMPGWGKSADNDRTEDALAMARTLRAATAALGIEHYALLGTSLGGVVCLWWATEAPDEVSSLILEAPAALRVRDPDPAALSDHSTYIKAFHAQPQRKPWLADGEPPRLRNPELFARMLGPKIDEKLVDRLRTLSVPTLVMFGSQDGVMSQAQGRLYKQVMTECVFVVVYDAAHDIKGDRPEAFADLVRSFLNPGSFLINHQPSILNL